MKTFNPKVIGHDSHQDLSEIDGLMPEVDYFKYPNESPDWQENIYEQEWPEEAHFKNLTHGYDFDYLSASEKKTDEAQIKIRLQNNPSLILQCDLSEKDKIEWLEANPQKVSQIFIQLEKYNWPTNGLKNQKILDKILNIITPALVKEIKNRFEKASQMETAIINDYMSGLEQALIDEYPQLIEIMHNADAEFTKKFCMQKIIDHNRKNTCNIGQYIFFNMTDGMRGFIDSSEGMVANFVATHQKAILEPYYEKYHNIYFPVDILQVCFKKNQFVIFQCFDLDNLNETQKEMALAYAVNFHERNEQNEKWAKETIVNMPLDILKSHYKKYTEHKIAHHEHVEQTIEKKEIELALSSNLAGASFDNKSQFKI